jgi:hypothetical protein
VTPAAGGFSFQSVFDAGPGGRRDVILGFFVTALTDPIIGSRLEIQASGAANTGNITVAESQCLSGRFGSNGACNSGVTASMFVFDNSVSERLVDTFFYGQGQMMMDVIKDIGVSGGTTGSAQFSLLFNTFEQEGGGAGPGEIPEPRSMFLMGTALLLGAAWVRRLRAG